jgi:cell division protein FtsZ
MHDAGSALMGIGRASGENRAVEAAKHAIASPLLEINITGAQGILFNISGSSNLTLFEVTEAAEEIRAAADPEANIIFGTSFDERLGEEVVITVIATGFDANRRRETVRRESVSSPYEISRGTRPERDFLGELESSRRAAADADLRPMPEIRPADRPPTEPPARPERSVGQEPAPVSVRNPRYDAEDLEIPSFLRRNR